jgi:Flp pilus assembly protein protease CpaA
MTIRGGLAGILIITGLKLLNVPEANWVLGVGLVTLLVVLTIYTVRVMLGEEPRTTPEHV